MRPTKSKGDCNYCYHLNENTILSQIEDVLKGIKIPHNILVEIGEELKKISNKEHVNYLKVRILKKRGELLQCYFRTYL